MFSVVFVHCIKFYFINRSPSQQEKDKELDDDEDSKNPQFIPKRGYFYEHDDRTKPEDEYVLIIFYI